MARYTVDRSVIRAEVERRQAEAQSLPAPVPVPAPIAPPARRWSARVLIVPAAFADALVRLANRAVHGAAGTNPPGQRHSVHRHRGVYIWRSEEAANMESADELLTMPDVSTAEQEIAKLKGKLH